MLTGYRAPLRKKTGKITKFMIAAKLSSDLDMAAVSIPRPEQARAVRVIEAMNSNDASWLRPVNPDITRMTHKINP